MSKRKFKIGYIRYQEEYRVDYFAEDGKWFCEYTNFWITAYLKGLWYKVTGR